MGFKSTVLSQFVRADGSVPFSGPQSFGGHNVANTGRVAQTPTVFNWSAGAATIDVSSKNDFVAGNVLTENSTLTMDGGVDGCQGTIYVKQGNPGNWELVFVAAGRTVLREDGSTDSHPKPDADSVTGYVYDFKTVAGTAYVIVSRLMLS